MATSGKKDVVATRTSSGNVGDTLRFRWSRYSYSVEKNETVIDWVLELIAGSAGYISSSTPKKWSVTVNGTPYSGTNTIGIGNNETKTLASGRTTIPHEADGTKTFSVSFSQQFDITFNTKVGTVSDSAAFTLDSIPRSSTFGQITGDTIGEEMTVEIVRNKDNFTHQLWYKVGESEWYDLGTGIEASKTFAIDMELCSQFRDAESGNMQLCVRTFDGDAKVGVDVYKNVTIKIPASVVPSVDSVTVTEAVSDIASKFGAFIQSKSKLNIVSAASGVYGSTIKSCRISAFGTTYSGNEVTTDFIKQSGESEITVTVTDSRGRSASKTVTVTVLEYFAPTIERFDAYRSDSAGNQKNDSKTLTCSYNFKIAKCGSKNDKSYKIEYRRVGTDAWTTLKSGATYNTDYIYTKDNIVNLEYSYEIRLTVSDYFTSVENSEKVSMEVVIWCPYPGGKGLGLGGYPTKEGLQVFFESEFYRNILLMDVDGNGTNLDLINTLTQIDSELANVNSDLAKLKTQKVLWSGAYYMQSSQTATLSEAISAQPNGIVLVWVDYNSATGSAGTQGYWMHYIPKKVIEEFAGRFYTCSTQKWSQNTACAVLKGFYLYDTKLVGHDCSINESASMNSKNSVLCRVYGV